MTAAARRRRQCGMTLIEILVVVVIIGIVATLVTISIGALGEDREMEREAERLTDSIALLQEQAQLEGRDYGMRLEIDSREFLKFDGLQLRWVAIEDDAWLRPRKLPTGLSFELAMEGRPVMLRQAHRPEAKLPQLIAYGSGDATPYRLSIVRVDGGRRITVQGAEDGSIEIERDAQR